MHSKLLSQIAIILILCVLSIGFAQQVVTTTTTTVITYPPSTTTRSWRCLGQPAPRR
ncbi:MAG: hypothetical protein QXG25_00505 [Nitrososphaerota archaeon]